jgi:hypothetical protein
MLSEIIMQRFAPLALEQRMKVHVGAESLRKGCTLSLAQAADARFSALVANFAALVAATMIKSHSGMSFGHLFKPPCG